MCDYAALYAALHNIEKKKRRRFTRSWKSDFCVSFFAVAYFKNTTPSGDIPRDHYQQHCQYRLRGLRCIACGLASSIINRSMHISNRWRHILSKKLGAERFRNQNNKSVFPYSGLNSVLNTEEYGGGTGLHNVEPHVTYCLRGR